MNKLFLTPLAILSSLAASCSSFHEEHHYNGYHTEIYTSPHSSQINSSNKNKPTYEPPYTFPETRPATGNKVFIFDPRQTAWAAYDKNGNLIKQGEGSGGKHYCPDTKKACLTPTGTYEIYRKGDASCASTQFPLGKGGAPMPYCMFFKGGYAIHGSQHVPNYNASHGCIRVTPEDAAWLSLNHIDYGSTVIVKPY